MNEIFGLYQNAQEQNREDAYVISMNEMTGAQALEHKYPDKIPLPGQCAEAVKALVGMNLGTPRTFVCDGLKTRIDWKPQSVS